MLTIDDFQGACRTSGEEFNYKVCPVCRSDRFKVYLNPETGRYICFAARSSDECNGKGGVVDTGRDLNKMRAAMRDENPILTWDDWEEIDLPDTDPLSDDAAEYLRSRGLSDDDQQPLGLAEATELGPGRIVIPYYDPHGRVIFWNSRLYEDDIYHQKYFTARGRKPLYVPEWGQHEYRADFVRSGSYRHLILVEGPFDAIAVHRHTLRPVAAIGGTTLPKYLRPMVYAMAREEITIFLDHDALDKAVRLARILEGRRDVRIVVPPPGEDPASLAPERLNELLK